VNLHLETNPAEYVGLMDSVSPKFISDKLLAGTSMMSSPVNDPSDKILARKCFIYNNATPELKHVTSPILTYSDDFSAYTTTFKKGIYSVKLAAKNI
jgi:hypothetical protein